eukprot:2264386-Pleurochrysis_carterae.AAC.1
MPAEIGVQVAEYAEEVAKMPRSSADAEELGETERNGTVSPSAAAWASRLSMQASRLSPLVRAAQLSLRLLPGREAADRVLRPLADLTKVRDDRH